MATQGQPLTLPLFIAQRAINLGLDTIGRPSSIKIVFELDQFHEGIPGMPENGLDGMSSLQRTTQWNYDKNTGMTINRPRNLTRDTEHTQSEMGLLVFYSFVFTVFPIQIPIFDCCILNLSATACILYCRIILAF